MILCRVSYTRIYALGVLYQTKVVSYRNTKSDTLNREVNINFYNVIIRFYKFYVTVGHMLFSNFNLKSKTLKIISLSLTLTGILFILGSNYIGSIAIRLAMILILIFCIANIKMTHKYLDTKEKVNYIIAVAASILGLIKPELTMLIIGMLLLFFTVPAYVNIIKARDYSDIVMLIINGTGILFASYCIINSKAALNTVIIIIGIIITIIGCLSLYDVFINKKPYIDSETARFSGFEDTSDM